MSSTSTALPSAIKALAKGNIYKALGELSAANQAYKVQCLRNRHLREAMPQIDTRHGGERNVRSQETASEVATCERKRHRTRIANADI